MNRKILFIIALILLAIFSYGVSFGSFTTPAGISDAEASKIVGDSLASLKSSDITLTGSLGIGANPPSEELHLYTSSSDDNPARIEIETGNSTKNAEILFTNDGGDAGGTAIISVGGSSSGSGSAFSDKFVFYGRNTIQTSIIPGSTSGKPLVFYSHLVPLTEVAKIKSSGEFVFTGSIKADTGDPGSPNEGQLQINTFDNAIKIYADGAWRTLSSW